MLEMASAAMEVSVVALVPVWERWLGPHRFSRKFAQLEQAGLAVQSAADSDTERVVRLTDAGRLAALGGRDPVACWQRAWDGRWRLVLFDVPEKKRSHRIQLQRQLRRLWFGYLQDSVWISPDPADTLRAALGGRSVDAAVLTFMEARPCSGESDADIVRGGWDFTRINRYYDDYLAILRSRSVSMGERSRRDWLQVEWKAWCRAVSIDPLLPDVLLPRSYRGRDAWERRQERMRRLLSAG